MLRPLSELSIRQKLRRVGLLTSTSALLSALAAFMVFDVVTYRRELVQELRTQAQIVGYNSISAILFTDPDAASQTLASLRAETHVLAAGIYDGQGRPFAVWTRDPGMRFELPTLGDRADGGHSFDRAGVRLFQPIAFESQRVGTVYLHADLGELFARMRRYIVILLLVFLGSSALSALISSRVQAGISRPILDLAETARVVSVDKDYSVRARPPGGRDEVAELVQTFNAMLARIQEREAELQEAQATLEHRVEQRTEELRRELAERRRAEEQLTRSRALLAEAQRLAQVGSWDWDIVTGSLSWSEEMYRLLGVEPGSLEPTFEVFLDRVHPDDREALKRAVELSVETGEAFVGEHRVNGVPGAGRTLYAHGTVERDASGRAVRMFGTGQDVTARRAAEEERAVLIREQAARAEAEASERRSAFLAQVSAELGASLDYEQTLATLARLVVPRLSDWCLVHIAEDGGVRPVAVAHVDPSKEPGLWELARRDPPDGGTPGGILEVLRTGKAVLHTTVPRGAGGKDDTLADLLSAVGFAAGIMTPLKMRDHTFGTMALGSIRRPYGATDLSLANAVAERAAIAVENARLYRQARDANRLKDEFLATLSHELRTPLNAIVGWASMLKSGDLDQSMRTRAIETIDRNARAQTRLIEDILDVSRIVSGKLRLDMKPLDMATVVAAALDSVRPGATAKGITVEVQQPRVPVQVQGDASRLQQVVWNLLSNAIKFTPEGGRVAVTTTVVGTHADVRVEDSGAGIAAEFLPHVFERFRQADSSSTRRHGGLGLGLSIVRHIVELHGGRVEVLSAGEGQGATFSFRIPLDLVVSNDEAPGDASVAAAGTALAGVKVLVVDDERDSRELLATILEQLGAAVQTAGSADEGFAAFEREPPHVLLSDIEMPGGDGYSLMKRVRELSAEQGGSVPAAALTAYARPEDRLAALQAGFQIHVSKPVQPQEIGSLVANLAGRHQG